MRSRNPDADRVTRVSKTAVRAAVAAAATTAAIAALAACSGSTPAHRAAAGPAPAATSSAAPGASGSATAAATAAATASAAASTGATASAVAAGSTGDTGVLTLPAVPLTATAHFSPTVSAVVDSTRSITATAQGPGEIAGPAVAVVMTIANTSSAAIDLGNVVVDLQDAAHASATPMTASPAAPFTGQLAPGATAQGTYVFSLGTNDRRHVSMFVTYSAEAPVAAFAGDVTS